MGAEVFHALKKTLHDRGLVDGGRRRGRVRARTSSPTRRRWRCWCEAIEAAGYSPGDEVAIALDPAASELVRRRQLRPRARGPHAHLGASWPTTGPTWPTVPDRLDRGRHGRGGLGRLEDRSPSASATGSSSSATTCSSPTRERLQRGIDAGVAQLDPDQGQPDRHAHRDARGDRAWPARPATPP